MDTNDLTILDRLQRAGRESWAQLGESCGMTGPAAADRVRRLEEAGVIRGFTAVVDPESVGARLGALVAVTLERPKHRRAFLARVAAIQEVQECHHVTGDDDYILKIRCENVPELERILGQELKVVPGVARTRTTIILRTEKETAAVPLPTEAQGGARRRSASKSPTNPREPRRRSRVAATRSGE
jgi:Lrp/AsnC family leucine-responsive transcriptional regulator